MTETRINIMDPQPVSVQPQADETPKVVYASVTERFVALLIDYGVIFIPGQFVGLAILKILGPYAEMWQIAAVLLGINALFVLYEAIFSSGDRVTLGKSLVGIAVVKQDLSGPISFPRAFMRAVGYYISGALLMCGFLFAFFDDRHRALHDFLGGSVVVQIRHKAWWENLMVRLLGSLLLAGFAWVMYQQCFGGGSVVQQYYVNRAKAQLQNVALLEEAHYARYGYYTNDLLRLSLLSGDPVQFQRDTQKALSPKGFRIGVQKDSYKIMAYAKDTKKTPVYFSSK